MRRDSTPAEIALWRALRENFSSWKFRRQHPIGRYVADFACPPVKLAIELDGGQHADQAEVDAKRSGVIAEHGYRVIRFWNNEVFENLDGVLATISSALGAV